MATLPYQPSYSSDYGYEPRVLKSQYGDGYLQRTQDGINNMPISGSLIWNLKRADGLILLAFLQNLKGVTSFSWQPPEASAPLKFICGSFKPTYMGRLMSIHASIQQVYE